MSAAKEIRSKIKSIQSTRKITSAMEMVAASKMRRAQQRMQASRPYADKMHNVIAHLAQAHPEYRHIYLQERAAKRVGYIIVSTDRGLCGGLNINLFRRLIRHMQAATQEGLEVDVCVIGAKALSFFRRFGGQVLAQITHLGDVARIQDLIGTVKVMLDAYDSGEIDRIYLAYNRFESTMSQDPRIEQILPIVAEQPEEKRKHHWDYLYEPESKEVLDDLLTRYVESLVYQGVVENGACEQSARMVAMKAASDNASSLIDELQLVYNKARQAAITQEISEIVGGAAAV